MKLLYYLLYWQIHLEIPGWHPHNHRFPHPSSLNQDILSGNEARCRRGVYKQAQLNSCKCGERGGGAGRLCSVILSSVSFSGFFPNQSLEKAEAGGVAGRGGTERLAGVPNLLGRTMYPSASLSLTLWCLGVLSGPPHPAKNPLHPTQAPTLQTVSFN